MNANDRARIVLRGIIGRELNDNITDKQYEYISTRYENVVKAILHEDNSYRGLYATIKREALEYEYGFRQ